LKTKINWWGVLFFFATLIVFAAFGVRLPQTINQINGLPFDAFYGVFVSYIVIPGSFWLMMRDIKLEVKNE